MQCLPGILLLIASSAAAAAEGSQSQMLGAQRLLDSLPPLERVSTSDRLDHHGDSSFKPPNVSQADQVTALRLKKDLAAFGTAQPIGDDTGKRWAALLERWITYVGAGTHAMLPGDDVSLRSVMAVLPPPHTWKQITETLRQSASTTGAGQPDIRQIAVLAFADQLAGDRMALSQRLAQVDAIAKSVNKRDLDDAHWATNHFRDMLDAAVNADSDPVAAFASQLKRSEPRVTPLRIPDLVTLAGESRARELLRAALTQTKVPLDIPVGDATRTLAAKVALEEAQHLHSAPWNLVRGLDCIAFYEALDKRFPRRGGGGLLSAVLSLVSGSDVDLDPFGADPDRSEADIYYFAALIAHGRSADAEGAAAALSADVGEHVLRPVFDALSAAGFDSNVYDFLDRFLVRHPNSGLWSLYFELAARTKQQEAMLKHVRASLETPEGQAYAGTLRAHLIDALLAADKVGEAVAEIHALVANPVILSSLRQDYGLKLAKLGRLEGKPEWVDAGLAAAFMAKGPTAAAEAPLFDGNRDESVLLLLRQLGRYAESEQRLAHKLAEQRRTYSGSATSTLVELAGLYHEAGRDADVLVLLDKAADWNTPDILSIIDQSDVRKIPLGYIVAAALHKAGKDLLALPILEAIIAKKSGSDPAYALYTQVVGKRATPYLDRTYARDVFEERPLIWKANLLLKAGALQDAERVARDAIAVDPSDGEEGPGDRMRVYAVLADILDARGNGKDAVVYRNAVQAIRDSEHADELRLAGLHTRAIAIYAKALERFADAYCIQSRLAIELNSSGDTLLAQEHYRRAYELMPSSFGRMESHCLGCERAFGGATAQTIAESVFDDLVKKMPSNPQVHYLLGYLREEQQRYPEAVTQYRVATSLDGDYLNAWKHLSELSEKIDVPRADRDAAALRLYELDPLRRHVYSSPEKVSDWASLYASAAKVHIDDAPGARHLYPLVASRARLAALFGAQGAKFAYDTDTFGAPRSRTLAPGYLIYQTTLVQAIAMVFGQRPAIEL